MNILGNILGFSAEQKEKMILESVQDALKSFCEELDCGANDIFVTIKPRNEDCEPRLDLYLKKDGKQPTHVREVFVKELIGD